MAYIDEDLWFINTRFSCLCSLDSAYSFVPYWHPPFVTAYDTGDRCHLNGLAVRDKPTFRTSNFNEDGTEIIGKTPCERATVIALQLNNLIAVTVRRQWVSAGWHPPESSF